MAGSWTETTGPETLKLSAVMPPVIVIVPLLGWWSVALPLPL
jgi:hypothetical protein